MVSNPNAKRPRGRPKVNSVSLNVRMPPDDLQRLDAWRLRQVGRPSRPEALRRLALKALDRKPKAPQHRWSDNPELMLFGIQSIGDVWQKLVWDVAQFETILLSKPVDIVSVPLAYPNVCVSAVALRDWFVDEMTRRPMAGRKPWTQSEAFELIRASVRWSQLAEDVANTFKHRGYRSSGFTDGLVDIRVRFPASLQAEFERLGQFEGALFAIRHNDVAYWTVTFRDAASHEQIDAVVLFTAWEQDWHALLNRFGLLDDEGIMMSAARAEALARLENR